MEKDERKNKEAIPTEFQALIAGVFPNTRYFDARFDLLQVQINELKNNQESMKIGLKDLKDDMNYRFQQVDKRFEQVDERINEFKQDVNRRFEQVDKRFEQVDKRFEQVDKRFEQVDKRFEQVDKRFEQVDKRFEQIIASIDRLADTLEHRDVDQRNFTIRMFSVSIAISILGALGAFLKIIGVL